MARGAYTESTAVRALRELVEFAEGGPQGYPLKWLALDRAYVSAATIKAILALPRLQLDRLQHELRAFVRSVGGGPENDYKQTTRLNVEIVPVKHAGEGPVKAGVSLRVNGSPRDVVLYQVATLLSTIGIDRLRLCPAPDCGRAFIKVGRREYCSERCQRRVFVSTYNPFKAQPRRKDRHGKKAR